MIQHSLCLAARWSRTDKAHLDSLRIYTVVLFCVIALYLNRSSLWTSYTLILQLVLALNGAKLWNPIKLSNRNNISKLPFVKVSLVNEYLFSPQRMSPLTHFFHAVLTNLFYRRPTVRSTDNLLSNTKLSQWPIIILIITHLLYESYILLKNTLRV